ncbi:MAG: cobalt ECF transporter T component CbiQ [Firmicutes bacterium]|nr:cobalt ECF transporter T component CbiQ [Bacillota bacterium]
MENIKIPEWLLEKQEPFPGKQRQEQQAATGSMSGDSSTVAPAVGGYAHYGAETGNVSGTAVQPVSAGDSGGCTCVRGRLSRRGFVEKTIEAMANVLREEFFAGQIAGKPGLLQGIDPRVKVLTTLLLIVVASLIHHALVLLVLNLWIIWVAKVSRIPLQAFLKRVWLVVPLFTGIIILPSVFNIVYPGDPLLTLFNFGHQLHIGFWTFPDTLAITSQGAYGALVLIFRVGASVSLAVILTLTTRWNVLLKTLNMIFVPQIFVTVLEMTYRYTYLFLQPASDIFVAWQSRTVGRTSTKEQRRFVSGAMGALWGKAYTMSEEVHAAMVSRGYTGRPKTLVTFKTKVLDWMWAAFIVFVSLFFLGGDRLIAR